ncbi:hypothetical protein AB0L40_26470, partial [Patulibacter sp. NPDC049589]
MPPARHLFVTRGDLTALHCDAWVLPTDREGTVTATWVAELERLGRGRADAYGGRLDDAARRDLAATGAAVLRVPSAGAPGVVASRSSPRSCSSASLRRSPSVPLRASRA